MKTTSKSHLKPPLPTRRGKPFHGGLQLHEDEIRDLYQFGHGATLAAIQIYLESHDVHRSLSTIHSFVTRRVKNGRWKRPRKSQARSHINPPRIQPPPQKHIDDEDGWHFDTNLQR